jgi:hypothetical protein
MPPGDGCLKQDVPHGFAPQVLGHGRPGTGSTVELEMAIISSSRRGTGIPGIAALLLMVAALGLAGCGNDNPSTSGGTMKVDIRGLKQQMGVGGPSTMSTGVSDSPATTAVKSLIIGAVVITFSNTPLDETTQVTSDLQDKLASDVINSINYFSIVDLPTNDDFVEFKVPPPSAGNWQVAALGTRDQILTYTDLDDENVAIYYGFSPKFYNTSGDSGPDVPITMSRACFIDSPPKGCAQYDETGAPVVTSDVLVYGVYLNNDTTTNHMPGGGPFANSAAVAAMNTARTNASPGPNDILRVTMTHPAALDFDDVNCDPPGDITPVGACMGVASTRF